MNLIGGEGSHAHVLAAKGAGIEFLGSYTEEVGLIKWKNPGHITGYLKMLSSQKTWPTPPLSMMVKILASCSTSLQW